MRAGTHADLPVSPKVAGGMRTVCYAAVWLAFACSSLVLVEPAPVDALTSGLVLLLPMVGLVLLSPGLLAYLCLWLVVIAAQVIAATQAPELGRALMHTVISFQLALVSVVVAAFIARDPLKHGRIVMSGWTVAAVIAAAAAIAGYFAVVPGAEELFTLYDRATGTFKDPNVFGPFLVPPVLYSLHVGLTRSLRRSAMMLGAGALSAFGLFLSFSRGAWFVLIAAIVLWGTLTFTYASFTERRRLARVCGIGAAAAVVLVAFALQQEEVARLIEMRASLSQDYDQGPEGRFGGQMKALALIAENPLGIGSLTFSPLHHHEEAHNVYLSMAMNAGWLGGGLYAFITLLTIGIGFARLPSAGRARPLLVIGLAAFVPTALEGLIIDSDHWRHLYIELALIWGVATYSSRALPQASSVIPL